MTKLSRIFKTTEQGHLSFFCPGCKSVHTILMEGPGSWEWDKNTEAPSFTPSVLVASGHHALNNADNKHCWCTYYKNHPEEEQFFACQRCHFEIVEGNLQYFSDSSHFLAGKTVDIPDYPHGLSGGDK